MTAPIITMTDAAVERAKRLMAGAEAGVAGLRVGISTRGCSGLSYVVEYADEQRQFEEVIERDGLRIFIDPAATMIRAPPADWLGNGLPGGPVPNRVHLQ